MMSVGLGILFDGLAYGMLLFLISIGLSVTMGLMGFVNLAHGAFAMFGGYLATVLMQQAGWPFLATLPAAFVVVALASVLVERVLYRRLYRRGPLDQVLFTIGLTFMAVAGITWIFGPSQQPVVLPDFLQGQTRVMGLDFGIYRLFLIAVGVAVTAAVVLGIERTRFGAMVRAAVDNPIMATGLGINVGGVFAVAFALGSGLAGLGGALGIQILGLDPSFPLKYLVFFLIVVSVGGLGSVSGTLLAACLVGVFDVFGKYYLPQVGAFIIYAVMVGLLMWRPNGLLGKRA
ncbi:branched-chain amino acid transport system permease protein [Pigmentiphaga litoralis]|uniref:Branched-chain amino acid transport system permease protein n=2 Tax=Pigmentiphaga litoralis TaxID=516702 RepID=A0A7Y9IU14_9BURK|nr:branched-chain amino acid transport system permease protein [Pigmentiphaga litoralis]NYE83031.1 branched-chain amino acid transport system permease protein [Pigmentiphaga litoralis]